MLSGKEIYENFLLRFSNNERNIMKNLARNIYELNKREFIIEFDENNIYKVRFYDDFEGCCDPGLEEGEEGRGELFFGFEFVVLEVLSTQAKKFKKGGYIEINYKNYPKIFDMDRNLI
ncbi:hypothetical protein [uncultured Campylobacter sp.]|uniref:hypothetical protein n=1 Tax=uncultured Campylobacter sp. TaxID=218934 RepID=UPI002605DD89|nr:hypothetical protein [uncultured Campylobacter sp.]